MLRISSATMLGAVFAVTTGLIGCSGSGSATGAGQVNLTKTAGPLTLSGVTNDNGDTVVNIRVGMGGALAKVGDATGVAFDMAYDPDQLHYAGVSPQLSQNRVGHYQVDRIAGEQATLSVTVDTGDTLTNDTLVLSLRFDRVGQADTDINVTDASLTAAGL